MADRVLGTPWHLVISAYDTRIVLAVRRVAEELGLAHETALPAELRVSEGNRDSVYCVGSRLAAELQRLPRGAVVVCTGAAIPDDALVDLTRAGCVALRFADLSPRRLLGAILDAMAHGDVAEDLLSFIRAEPHLGRLSSSLLDALLLAPARAWTLEGMAEVMKLSPSAARRALRAQGFRHPAHLMTAFRVRAWEGLVRVGFRRAGVERYLGISDHPTFRRACGRAGVAVPWAGGRRGGWRVGGAAKPPAA